MRFNIHSVIGNYLKVFFLPTVFRHCALLTTAPRTIDKKFNCPIAVADDSVDIRAENLLVQYVIGETMPYVKRSGFSQQFSHYPHVIKIHTSRDIRQRHVVGKENVRQENKVQVTSV